MLCWLGVRPSLKWAGNWQEPGTRPHVWEPKGTLHLCSSPGRQLWFRASGHFARRLTSWGEGGAQLAPRKEAAMGVPGSGAQERWPTPEGRLTETDKKVSLVPKMDKWCTFKSSHLTATESLLGHQEFLGSDWWWGTLYFTVSLTSSHIFFQSSRGTFISAWLGISMALPWSIQLALRHGHSNKQESLTPFLLLPFPPISPGQKAKAKTNEVEEASVQWLVDPYIPSSPQTSNQPKHHYHEAVPLSKLKCPLPVLSVLCHYIPLQSGTPRPKIYLGSVLLTLLFLNLLFFFFLPNLF